ncbi:MAG TPA: EAL domain-containing protein [Hyphomonadaceae bacterium]|jgi:diguanylate cyclase (GGDEF)-like protein|nr:EAL domain-containing protein [Hyphomonadaceae bacterium]
MRVVVAKEPQAERRGLDQQTVRDILIFAAFNAAGYIFAVQLDAFARLEGIAKGYHGPRFDEFSGMCLMAAIGLVLYVFTRLASKLKFLGARVKEEEAAARAAMHDQLTGLPNRRHLKAILNWHLSQTGDARKLAIIAINLDNFRDINELHGRPTGDELLVQVGQILNMRAGVHGFAARLGQDDFVVVLLRRTEDQLMDWMSALLTQIETPIKLTNKEVDIGATIGVAIAPTDGGDAETLLHRADVALQRAKDKTRGWFGFFKAGMDERVHERAAFEHDLWAAVRDDVMEPWFQPLASLDDGNVRGYEILARWNHAERGMVSPDQFIPAAEGAALIGDLTLNVMRKACREAAAWPGQPIVSINLSPVLLQDRDIDRKILKVLVETGFQPGRLEIELTETGLVADYDAARAIFTSLKEQGVRIALDNFGEGHTSLRQLRELPFDKVKIDRSFVQAMNSEREALVMVRTIVAMAQNLSLAVVAEGITSLQQAKQLHALGCGMGQGELFGLAAPAATFVARQTAPQRPGIPRELPQLPEMALPASTLPELSLDEMVEALAPAPAKALETAA